MADSPPPRLRLTKLARSFRGQAALADFSLDVAAGECVALLGGAGAGKSTLVALVAGLLRPDGGTIALDGAAPRRGGIAAVFDPPALFGHLTVERNIALAGGATAEMLDLFGLAARRQHKAATLGPGETVCVALARALARRPRLLLLDAPFTGLERAEREAVFDTLHAARARLGLTILLATRDAGEAMALADRIAVMVAGRLRQCAPPREIYDAPADAAVARLTGEDNRLPGLIEDVEDGIARVRLACGPLVEADAGGLAAGRRCIVSVRPERIAVAAVSAADMGEGAIPGMLRDLAFRGDHVRLTIAVGGYGGDLAVVRRPATAPLAGLSPGADLALAWQPHHARALLPEAGT